MWRKWSFFFSDWTNWNASLSLSLPYYHSRLSIFLSLSVFLLPCVCLSVFVSLSFSPQSSPLYNLSSTSYFNVIHIFSLCKLRRIEPKASIVKLDTIDFFSCFVHVDNSPWPRSEERIGRRRGNLQSHWLWYGQGRGHLSKDILGMVYFFNFIFYLFIHYQIIEM